MIFAHYFFSLRLDLWNTFELISRPDSIKKNEIVNFLIEAPFELAMH